MDISEPSSTAPFANTRPSDKNKLAAALGRLGLRSTADQIVLYSRGPGLAPPAAGEAGGRVATGMMWATRCWWVLWSWGFENVSVLDGGYERWQADGRPITATGPLTHPPMTFDTATLVNNAAAKAGKDEVLELVDKLANGVGCTQQSSPRPRFGGQLCWNHELYWCGGRALPRCCWTRSRPHRSREPGRWRPDEGAGTSPAPSRSHTLTCSTVKRAVSCHPAP